MTNSLRTLALALVLAPTAACRSAHAPAADPAPAAVASPTPAAPSLPGLRHDVVVDPPMASAPAEAGALRFAARPGWIVETPSSAMRRAQFVLPGPDGAAAASLVVYHFGSGGGGGTEANLERWAGQFEQPDGSDSRARLQSSNRSLNGMAVTDVDLSGTYVAETAPGSGVRVREPGWRMLASILAAPEGAYYVKLIGPATTVMRWQADYRAFVDASVP